MLGAITGVRLLQASPPHPSRQLYVALLQSPPCPPYPPISPLRRHRTLFRRLTRRLRPSQRGFHPDERPLAVASTCPARTRGRGRGGRKGWSTRRPRGRGDGGNAGLRPNALSRPPQEPPGFSHERIPARSRHLLALPDLQFIPSADVHRTQQRVRAASDTSYGTINQSDCRSGVTVARLTQSKRRHEDRSRRVLSSFISGGLWPIRISSVKTSDRRQPEWRWWDDRLGGTLDGGGRGRMGWGFGGWFRW